MQENIRNHIKDFIYKHFVAVLGVADDTTPYVCTIFYVTDDAKNLYFKSRTGSNHSRVLSQNPHAALAIYAHESTYKNKKGIQVIGKVERVADPILMAKVVKMYSNAFEGAAERFEPIDSLISSKALSSMYRFTVDKVKMVDGEDLLIAEYQVW